MTGNLRIAFFSALLVIAVAVPVFGLKLTTVGIRVEVHGAEAGTFWIIAACAVAMFVWQLFRTHLAAGWAASPSLPSVPAGAGNFLTLPSTQRWIILALVLVALVWPFYGSRGAVDIATLILIYVMLGLGLNIVVGLAGLLDLGYVGFTPWAPTPTRCCRTTTGRLSDRAANRRSDGRTVRLPARFPGTASTR